jgi:hypothetical protein
MVRSRAFGGLPDTAISRDWSTSAPVTSSTNKYITRRRPGGRHRCRKFATRPRSLVKRTSNARLRKVKAFASGCGIRARRDDHDRRVGPDRTGECRCRARLRLFAGRTSGPAGGKAGAGKVAQPPPRTANVASLSAANNSIGYNAASGSLDLNAKIAAIIFYSRALTGPETASVEAYLNAKWGV